MSTKPKEKKDEKNLTTNFHKSLGDILGTIEISTPFGEHLLVERSYPDSHIHGNVQLNLIYNISGEIIKLIAKCPDYEDLDFRRAVFIDTETTGLAGGSGT